MFLLQLE